MYTRLYTTRMHAQCWRWEDEGADNGGDGDCSVHGIVRDDCARVCVDGVDWVASVGLVGGGGMKLRTRTRQDVTEHQHWNAKENRWVTYSTVSPGGELNAMPSGYSCEEGEDVTDDHRDASRH